MNMVKLSVADKRRAVAYALRPGKGIRKAADRFRVDQRTIQRLIALKRDTGDVVRPKANGPQPTMTEPLKDELYNILVSSPRKFLKENLVAFQERAGIRVKYSTFTKTVKKLGFSRKKLRAFARKRDAAASLAFKASVRDRIAGCYRRSADAMSSRFLRVGRRSSSRTLCPSGSSSSMRPPRTVMQCGATGATRCVVYRPSTRTGTCLARRAARRCAALTSMASSIGSPLKIPSTGSASWRHASCAWCAA